jgi:L-amino acid N-acyltransferase YncA
MEVRDAGLEDLPGLLAIYNEVIATSTAIYADQPVTLANRDEWWKARVALGYPVMVAVDPTGVLGFASFGDFRAWPGYRFTVEHTVHVRTDRRGQGVGSALVDSLLGRASSLGKHVMIAGVDADNEPSLRFHERLGFIRVGHFRQVGFKFGRWLDLIFLQRFLGDAADSKARPSCP